MEMENVLFIGDVPILTPIFSGFPLATFDYRMVISPNAEWFWSILLSCFFGAAAVGFRGNQNQGHKCWPSSLYSIMYLGISG